MLHHIALPQNSAENCGILFNDRGIGNHIDHSVHAVFHCVLQGEGKRRNGFSAAGGNRQRIHAPGLRSSVQALPQDVAAVSIQFRFAGEPRLDIGIQPIQQHRQRVISVSQLVLL